MRNYLLGLATSPLIGIGLLVCDRYWTRYQAARLERRAPHRLAEHYRRKGSENSGYAQRFID